MERETRQIAGDIDAGVYDAFFEQWKNLRKQRKNSCIETAIKIWIALPCDVQAVCMESKGKDFYRVLLSAIQKREIGREMSKYSEKQLQVLARIVKEGTEELLRS
jgi:rubrerythrin